MIFVDAGAWYAALVASDPDHPAAASWLDRNAEPLVTSDYVVDELLTLLKMRGEYRRAREVGPSLLNGDVCELHRVTPDDVGAAWEVFAPYQDKGWSFTDCVSLAVMGRLGVRTAFAFDAHFRQFGTVTVVP